MYQRHEGSWRKRNEALKGKVLQDVGGFFFGEVKLIFFPFFAKHRMFFFLPCERLKEKKKCPKLPDATGIVVICCIKL